MNLLRCLSDYLHEEIEANGLGRLYSLSELCEKVTEFSGTVSAEDVAAALADSRGIKVSFRGGHGTARVKLDNANRTATLQKIENGWYSLNTEAAVQSGLQQWFKRKGYLAKREVPDHLDGIIQIAQQRSIGHLPDEPKSRSTHCRDLMAHAPSSPTRTFHILEAKGLTQVESDFYDTFGQVFPITDPKVTKGWTNNKTPKHGLCHEFAQRFVGAWSASDGCPLVTLVVVVPDFPPWKHDSNSFFDEITLYYSKQVDMYTRFLIAGDIAGDGAFPRLLRHLRDRYGLLGMTAATSGIAFRFWGYQGLAWVRDFATNEPVRLA